MPASVGVINNSFSNLSRLQRCHCNVDVDKKKKKEMYKMSLIKRVLICPVNLNTQQVT